MQIRYIFTQLFIAIASTLNVSVADEFDDGVREAQETVNQLWKINNNQDCSNVFIFAS